MRKFILGAAIAALGAAVLAAPAVAFDHHFTVFAVQKSFHEAGPNRFVDTDKLFDPNNRSRKVGRDRAKCHGFSSPPRVKCHAFFRLNGRIGGIGIIRVRGDLDPAGDNRVNVVGGSGQFNGVAGKMKLHGVKGRRFHNRMHFDLVR